MPGAGPVDMSVPPETVAPPPVREVPRRARQPAGTPGPPENSSPTVGLRVTSPFAVSET